VKVFIADKLPEWFAPQVRERGIEPVIRTGLKGADLAAAVGQAQPEVMIVRSTKAPSAVIDASGNLSLIIRAGSGVDNIDTNYAAARGIYVANCPGTNAAAVAELVFALLLAVDRRIPDNVADLRNGKWAKKIYSKAEGIKAKTLGVIGVGAIGAKVIARARAFEMNVIAWSRSFTPERAENLGVGYCSSPRELVKGADAVSLHVASAPETRGMVNANFLNAMKPGAILINAARGDLVVLDDLIAALKAGKIRAALDVYPNEPGAADERFDHPLRGVPNWIGSHHIGASTSQAQDETAAEALRVLTAFARTGHVPNCVNMSAPVGEHGACRLVIRHLDKVGVLAGALERLRDEGINVEEMENRIFDGAKAAVCYMTVSKKPSDKALQEFADDDNIMRVQVVTD